MKNKALLDRRPLTLPLHAQGAAHGGLLSGRVSDANDPPHTTRAMVACTQPAGRKVMRWTMADAPTMASWMHAGVDGVVADPPELGAPCR